MAEKPETQKVATFLVRSKGRVHLTLAQVNKLISLADKATHAQQLTPAAEPPPFGPPPATPLPAAPQPGSLPLASCGASPELLDDNEARRREARLGGETTNVVEMAIGEAPDFCSVKVRHLSRRRTGEGNRLMLQATGKRSRSTEKRSRSPPPNVCPPAATDMRVFEFTDDDGFGRSPAAASGGGQPPTSITSLQLSLDNARRLSEALHQGFEDARGYSSRGYSCSLALKLDGEEGSPTGFHGWSDFRAVRGTKHNAKAQRRVTAVLFHAKHGMDKLGKLRAGLAGFVALERLAYGAAPGHQVHAVHVLRQSSQQACSDFHRDNAVLDYRCVRKTIVVLLSDTPSSMQMEGEEEFIYEKMGAAAIFDSGSSHRSGNAAPGVLKAVLMLSEKSHAPCHADVEVCDSSIGGRTSWDLRVWMAPHV